MPATGLNATPDAPSRLAPAAVWLTVVLIAPTSANSQQAITLEASDGVTVQADYYAAADTSGPLILLFHQAGSNRAEYAPIAPRLVGLGFNCLALDQRSGGTMWGQRNATAEHLESSADYLDALADLEAALAWARSSGRGRRVLVWGSSYSAALVFLLAAQHGGEVAGVLAFSPGEYLDARTRVRDAAAKVTVPIFVTSAKDDEEIAAARSILAAARSRSRVQFVPRIAGVHGSSTLRADRNRAGAAENWQAVEAFLKAFR